MGPLAARMHVQKYRSATRKHGRDRKPATHHESLMSSDSCYGTTSLMKHKAPTIGLGYRYLFGLLLLGLAVIAQILILYHHQNDQPNPNPSGTNLPPESDVISALKRVKTDACRKSIKDFARNKQTNNKHAKYLKRTCPLDSKSADRIVRLGCSNQTSPSKNQSLFVTLEDSQPFDSNSCGEQCFSFNHVYAAYDSKLRKCHCGDDELMNTVSLTPCNLEQIVSHSSQLEWLRVNSGVYLPPRRRNRMFTNTAGREVRIAFLLSLNGRSDRQIRRLVKNIYSKKHIYYIHVDKRQAYLAYKLESLLSKYDNVLMSSKRFETIWGGPALLSMMLNSMSELKVHKWDYLLNLSESDFPLKNLSNLERYLGKRDPQTIYLKAHNMKGYDFVKKQGLNYDFLQCESRVWRLGRRHLPLGVSYTGGSDWFGLPREFCDYIVAGMKDRQSLVSSLLEVFSYTLLPAESFFHTLALNSEHCDNLVDHNLRITNWHRKQGCKCLHGDVVDWCGCSPLVYRWPDRQRLKQTSLIPSLFFTRKFDPTVSSSVIGFVEAHLVKKLETATKIDTRYWLNVYDHRIDAQVEAYKAFGEFAVNSSMGNHFSSSLKLTSINLYYKDDQFVGIIYQYCTYQHVCSELLISPKDSSRVSQMDNDCFGPDLALKSLKISRDFDLSEKLFKNHMPLDSTSDISVHHVWTNAFNSTYSTNSSNTDVRFSWINPRENVELIQDAHIKMARKPTRLSFVHRLNKKKPISAGLWSLRISFAGRNCLEYQFLVVNETSFTEQNLSQEHFDRFYAVVEGCNYRLNSTGLTKDDCQETPSEWSLVSQELHHASFPFR